MKVVWSRTALGHLTGIYDYISGDSQNYARRTVDCFTSRSKQIANFPESGQIVPEYQDPKIREVIEEDGRRVQYNFEIAAAQQGTAAERQVR